LQKNKKNNMLIAIRDFLKINKNMVLSAKIGMYFFSLSLLTLALLLFVTVGGIFSSYIYKKIGDPSSWDNGYNSLNPFNHIDYFVVIFFIVTGWFIGMKKPSFEHNFLNGIKGFLQKIIYFIAPMSLHLILASFLLFLGVYLFSYDFLLLAFKTSLKANPAYVTNVFTILQVKGPKLILSLFSLYSIVLNLNLAILSFLFSILDYIIKKYFFEDMFNIKFIFLLYAFVLLLLYVFGNSIMYFFWNIVIMPLFLLV
jgi:hypothetical protein